MSQNALPSLSAPSVDAAVGIPQVASPAVSAPAPRPSRGGPSRRLRGAEPEAGMATAEYAVATVAACGFGAVLIKAITDERVLGLVINVISKALRLGLG